MPILCQADGGCCGNRDEQGQTSALLVCRVYSPERDFMHRPPSPMYRRHHHWPGSESLLRSLPESSLFVFINIPVVGAAETTEEPDKPVRPSTQKMVCEQLVGHWESLHWARVSEYLGVLWNASLHQSGFLACSPPDLSKLG